MDFEQRSPLAKRRIDLALERDDVYATAELKRTATGTFCHWIVSGLSMTGLPTMLLDIAVPLASSEEPAMLSEAKAFAEKFILPMAKQLSSTPGAGERVPSLNVETRRWLFEEHMQHHFSPKRAGNLTLQRQTEALFNMATFLEVVAPLKSIAQFQNVAVGTVESRIKKGRGTGAIPKASEVRARNKSLKKGLDA
ncbi:MAG: hypothetical protein RLZZ471_973 [Actinomycetota bacterium]|jgi:hypothetical protein